MDSGARTHQQNRGNATQTGRSGPTQPGNSAESSTPASVTIQTKAAYGVYTHFLSLPLAHPTLVNKLDNFRNTITKEFGIHESIFNKTKSLHLTLRMLELRGEERIKKAAEVIQNVSSKVMDALENRPLLIRLNGLDLMSGTKDKALILHAPAEVIGGESRLLSAIKVITDALIDADLIPRNDTGHPLKLHVTLMKASFKRRVNIYDAVVPFDARSIFELYGREAWGEYAISEASFSDENRSEWLLPLLCFDSFPPSLILERGVVLSSSTSKPIGIIYIDCLKVRHPAPLSQNIYLKKHV